MKYRTEIDGLRTVTAVPVVLFHAGLGGLDGVFVGVDIFFVISGFLITSILMGDIQADRFSLLTFYERRVRRIFPALFAVLVVSTGLAAWLMNSTRMPAVCSFRHSFRRTINSWERVVTLMARPRPTGCPRTPASAVHSLVRRGAG